MTLTPLTKFYGAMILSWVYFWVAISIPYLVSRGLSAAEAVGLISIYNTFTVLFEYPTGVFGDVFGYKKSVFLANIFGIFAMIALAQPGTYQWYLLSLIVLSLAVTFQSGSDVGMLKAVARDIRKSSADYKFFTDLTLFFSAIVGGIIAKQSFTLALYLNAGIWAFGAIAILLVPLKQAKIEDNNIFKTAAAGLRFVKHSQPLMALIILGTVVGGYSLNLKSIFGSLSNVFSLSVDQIGMLVGVGALIRAFGAKTFPKIDLPLWIIAYSVALLACVTALGQAPIVIAALLASQFINGYFMAKADATTHSLVADQYRASVFSLKKLSVRLFASGHLAVASFLLGRNAFAVLFLITAILLIVVGYIYKRLQK